MTKSNFMLRDALSRYTSSVGIRRHLPLKGEGLLSGFALVTEIFRLRRPEFTPFFARAKERRQNPLTRNLRKKARSGGSAAK